MRRKYRIEIYNYSYVNSFNMELTEKEAEFMNRLSNLSMDASMNENYPAINARIIIENKKENV